MRYADHYPPTSRHVGDPQQEEGDGIDSDWGDDLAVDGDAGVTNSDGEADADGDGVDGDDDDDDEEEQHRVQSGERRDAAAWVDMSWCTMHPMVVSLVVRPAVPRGEIRLVAERDLCVPPAMSIPCTSEVSPDHDVEGQDQDQETARENADSNNGHQSTRDSTCADTKGADTKGAAINGAAIKGDLVVQVVMPPVHNETTNIVWFMVPCVTDGETGEWSYNWLPVAPADDTTTTGAAHVLRFANTWS